jgi:atypical dual specificity phosphatase
MERYGGLLMVLDEEQSARWSRYGMMPYNWVSEGKIMASVYPLDLDYLIFLRESEDIRTSINLSEYPWPDGWQEGSGISNHHFPVVDMTAPSEIDVKRIIEIIDENEGPVMIHCAAGIGRTGTVIALYLVEHGMEPGEAVSLVRKKRPGSIQTYSQESMVHKWTSRKV